MALTYTPPSNSRLKCPLFSLPAVDGNTYSPDHFKEKILVIMFICNHCPYVLLLEKRIIHLVQHFKNKSVRFVGICSNDAQTYPEDSFMNMKKRARQKNIILLIFAMKLKKQRVFFSAVCTPDFFIYNEKRKQVWRGRFDDSVESEKEVSKEEMKLAIQDLLENKKPSIEHPSFGCSIKWI